MSLFSQYRHEMDATIVRHRGGLGTVAYTERMCWQQKSSNRPRIAWTCAQSDPSSGGDLPWRWWPSSACSEADALVDAGVPPAVFKILVCSPSAARWGKAARHRVTLDSKSSQVSTVYHWDRGRATYMYTHASRRHAPRRGCGGDDMAVDLDA